MDGWRSGWAPMLAQIDCAKLTANKEVSDAVTGVTVEGSP